MYYNQDKNFNFSKEELQVLTKLPAFRYMKAPVDTASELYNRYPDGLEKGAFCYVIDENTFYAYSPKGKKWKKISADDNITAFFDIDSDFATTDDILVWDHSQDKFAIKSGNIWNKVKSTISQVSQVTKFFNEVASVPSEEDDTGIYFVDGTSTKGLYLVLASKPVKIFDSTDWYPKTDIDTKVSTINNSVSDLKNNKVDKSDLSNLVAGLIYKGSVNSVSNLSSIPNPEKGWAYYVISEIDPETKRPYIYQYDGSSWNNTGLTKFPSDVATLEDFDIITKSGSFNFLDNYRWSNGPTGLSHSSIYDYTIIEPENNKYFDYVGRCVRLFNSNIDVIRDWRIAANNIQANVGQKIRVTAEIYAMRATYVYAQVVLNDSDILAETFVRITEGFNLYNVEFDFVSGTDSIQLFIPANLSNNPYLEIYIGRVYIGLASFGSIDGDNVLNDIQQKYSTEQSRFILISSEDIGGEYLNGAVATDNGYTIPADSTGTLSYVAQRVPIEYNIDGCIEAYFETNLPNRFASLLDLKSYSGTSIEDLGSNRYKVKIPFPANTFEEDYKPRLTIQFTGQNQNAASYFKLLEVGFYSTDLIGLRSANQILIQRSIKQQLENSIGGIDIQRLTFGVEPSYSSAFNANDKNGIATNYDPATTSGLLKSIKYKAENEGIARFGVGFMDQRNIAIINQTFELDVTVGRTTYDVSDLNVSMEEGMLLFVYIQETGRPCFGTYTGQSSKQMYYNGNNPSGTLNPLPTTYGGYVDLSWIILNSNQSFFTPIYETQALSNKVEENSDNISYLLTNQNIFTDASTGLKYKLKIIDGSLELVSLQYKKALCIGNSMTWHGKSEGVWWGEWGMAAYRKEEDYVHYLQQGLRKKDPAAVAIGMNGFAWERDFETNKSTLLDSYLTSDTDLIVFRIGENIPSPTVSTLQPAFKSLVQYCSAKCPKAEIIITGVFWTSANCDTAFRNVAEELGYTFIPMSHLNTSEYKEVVGNMVMGDDGIEHEIINAGVANHPSSKGMKAKANLILQAIGYETL